MGLHVQYVLFFSEFNKRWICSTDFRKILKYEILQKSVQRKPSCCIQMDRQEELIFAFGNFGNAPKDGKSRRLKPVTTENERYVPYNFKNLAWKYVVQHLKHMWIAEMSHVQCETVQCIKFTILFLFSDKPHSHIKFITSMLCKERGQAFYYKYYIHLNKTVSLAEISTIICLV